MIYDLYRAGYLYRYLIPIRNNTCDFTRTLLVLCYYV